MNSFETLVDRYLAMNQVFYSMVDLYYRLFRVSTHRILKNESTAIGIRNPFNFHSLLFVVVHGCPRTLSPKD